MTITGAILLLFAVAVGSFMPTVCANSVADCGGTNADSNSASAHGAINGTASIQPPRTKPITKPTTLPDASPSKLCRTVIAL